MLQQPQVMATVMLPLIRQGDMDKFLQHHIHTPTKKPGKTKYNKIPHNVSLKQHRSNDKASCLELEI